MERDAKYAAGRKGGRGLKTKKTVLHAAAEEYADELGINDE